VARPLLIKDWNLTPTNFGEQMKDALHRASATR
jgi:hypothetical protein